MPTTLPAPIEDAASEHYASRTDVEKKWGPKMALELADPDGTRVMAEVDNRFEEALVYADVEIDTAVVVPALVPAIVRHVAVALASAWLNGRPDAPGDENETGKLIAGELKWAEAKLKLWSQSGLDDSDPTTSMAIGTGSISVVTRGRPCRY